MSEFPRMAERLPAGSVGEARVEHFDVTQDDARWSAFRGECVSAGRYARLYVEGRLMMSDTNMERNSNWEFAYRANGRVLIAGLGLGMILDPVLAKPEVTSVEVIEKSADVIALIRPHFRDPKLTVIEADVMEWRPPKGRRWDTVYFDIWPDICEDNLDDMATLHRRFGRRLNRDNPNCWMGSWQRGELLRLRRSGRRRVYW